jgi:NADH-quinone oxidoreductase subunit M
MNALPWTIYLSFAGALLCYLAGPRRPSIVRALALTSALAGLGAAFAGAAAFVPSPGLQTIVNSPWIPEFGIRYHLAADGISLTLIVLTGLAATAGILFSWNIEERTGEFFALYLALIGGVYGVFLSSDAFLFFVFYEIAIVPKYFLIANWGSTNREYGAMKLVLYSFAGSALVLVGLLWTFGAGRAAGFDLADLAQAAMRLPPGTQTAIFALLFAGFATLAGMFPLHTWAPTGHVAAPTAASMLLAGVVMKLGAYGCLRVAMPLFPTALATWQPVIGWLAVIGIVYAGLIALVQDDFKFVIGYSSVSHMGFVLLGLAAATPQAVAGSVLQMFSHGIIAGLLFAVVGRMVYERTHTRRFADLRRMPLHRLMPFATVTFVIAALASMGMPGFSGFPAELTILVGTWQRSPLWAFVGATGILIAAAFTLRAVQVSFFGAAVSGGANTDAALDHPLPPITWPEKIGAGLLIATTVYVGLKPDVLLSWITPALQSPLMQAALKGGTP